MSCCVSTIHPPYVSYLKLVHSGNLHGTGGPTNQSHRFLIPRFSRPLPTLNLGYLLFRTPIYYNLSPTSSARYPLLCEPVLVPTFCKCFISFYFLCVVFMCQTMLSTPLSIPTPRGGEPIVDMQLSQRLRHRT